MTFPRSPVVLSSFFFFYFFFFFYRDKKIGHVGKRRKKKRGGCSKNYRQNWRREKTRKVTVDCTPLIPKCAVVVLPFNVIDRAESKLHTHRHSSLFYRRFLLIGKKKSHKERISKRRILKTQKIKFQVICWKFFSLLCTGRSTISPLFVNDDESFGVCWAIPGIINNK